MVIGEEELLLLEKRSYYYWKIGVIVIGEE